MTAGAIARVEIDDFDAAIGASCLFGGAQADRRLHAQGEAAEQSEASGKSEEGFELKHGKSRFRWRLWVSHLSKQSHEFEQKTVRYNTRLGAHADVG